MPFWPRIVSTLFITAFTCRPSDSTVFEDAGIEPKNVATLALPVRLSNRPDRFYNHTYIKLHPVSTKVIKHKNSDIA